MLFSGGDCMRYVAFIDSGVSLNTCGSIQRFVVKEGAISTKVTVRNESHGDKVVACALYEEPRINILSIQMLDYNNCGDSLDLITAMEFCIDKKVDIINISLGISLNRTQKKEEITEVFQRAYRQGIVVIAADSNNDEYVYPSKLPFVLSVSSKKQPSNKTFVIDQSNNAITASHNQVLNKLEIPSELLMGNSYLCGVITGLVCTYFYSQEEISLNAFFSWLDQYQEHIFYYGTPLTQSTQQIYYIQVDIHSSYDAQVIKDLKKTCPIIVLSLEQAIKELISKDINVYTEKIVIGCTSVTQLKCIKKECKEKIASIAEKYPIVLLLPLLNIMERYVLYKKYGHNVQSMYF